MADEDQPKTDDRPTAADRRDADVQETLVGLQAEVQFWKHRAVTLHTEINRLNRLNKEREEAREEAADVRDDLPDD